MNYSQLVQLYFERTTALQSYWTLYVVIVGGVLAFSSLRKQPAAVTTLIVSILFALFAYENLSAILDTAEQRFATLTAIQRANDTADLKTARETIQPTLHPASYGSTKTTHLVSDALTIAGLWAMELRRRRLHPTPAAA